MKICLADYVLIQLIATTLVYPNKREMLNGVIQFENLKIEMAFQCLKNQELLARNYKIIFNARKDMLFLDTENH